MTLTNKRILITCGPTWIPIDDIRTISNTSTGELGQKIALGLNREKAQVTLLEGPVEVPLTSQAIKILKFNYYTELSGLMEQELKKGYDAIVHASAVGDYQLEKPFKTKLSSRLKALTLRLIPTPKIIKLIKQIDPNIFLVGFKQESTLSKPKAKALAQHLMEKAGCDLVVVNLTKREQYHGYIFDKNGKIQGEAHARPRMSQELIKVMETCL